MFKILLIALGVWILFIIMRSYKSHVDQTSVNSTKPSDSEDMVPCTVCGIHFPKCDGYLFQEHYYCSQEHLPKS